MVFRYKKKGHIKRIIVDDYFLCFKGEKVSSYLHLEDAIYNNFHLSCPTYLPFQEDFKLLRNIYNGKSNKDLQMKLYGTLNRMKRKNIYYFAYDVNDEQAYLRFPSPVEMKYEDFIMSCIGKNILHEDDIHFGILVSDGHKEYEKLLSEACTYLEAKKYLEFGGYL